MKSKRPKKKPHPDLKYSAYAYNWYFLAVMCMLWGIASVTSARIGGNKRGAEPIVGAGAQVLGWGLIAYGGYMIYILAYRSRKIELAQPGFHELVPFEGVFDSHNVRFNIDWSFLPTKPNGSGMQVFYYSVKVSLKNGNLPPFRIARRGHLGVIWYYLGPGRIGDIPSGDAYFDSRYRVSSKRTRDTKSLLSNQTLIQRITRFDRDYPPILTKNGWLDIQESHILYREGPYPTYQKIFQQHRGRLDLLIADLVEIANVFK